LFDQHVVPVSQFFASARQRKLRTSLRAVPIDIIALMANSRYMVSHSCSHPTAASFADLNEATPSTRPPACITWSMMIRGPLSTTRSPRQICFRLSSLQQGNSERSPSQTETSSNSGATDPGNVERPGEGKAPKDLSTQQRYLGSTMLEGPLTWVIERWGDAVSHDCVFGMKLRSLIVYSSMFVGPDGGDGNGCRAAILR